MSKAIERIDRARLNSQPCGKSSPSAVTSFARGNGHTIGTKLINNSYRRSVAVRATASVRRANCWRFFFSSTSLSLSFLAADAFFCNDMLPEVGDKLVEWLGGGSGCRQSQSAPGWPRLRAAEMSHFRRGSSRVFSIVRCNNRISMSVP